MSVALRAAGSVDYPFLRWASPVTRGLQGAYILGGTLDRTIRNHASASAVPLTVTGSPVIGENYARCTSLSAFFTTDFYDAADMTYFAIAKSPTTPTTSGNGGVPVGNFLSTDVGAVLYSYDSGGDAWRANISTDNAGTSVGVPASSFAVVTAWSLLTLRGGATAGKTILGIGDVEVESAAYTYARDNPSTNLIRIGSAYGTVTGAIDVAAVVCFGVALTSIEIVKVKAALRELCAARSITLAA